MLSHRMLCKYLDWIGRVPGCDRIRHLLHLAHDDASSAARIK